MEAGRIAERKCMSQDTSFSNAASPSAHEETWRQIEDVLDQISQSSRSTVTGEQFFTELLDGSIRTLAAVGGAIWLRQPEGLRLEYQVNLAATGLLSSGDDESSQEKQQIHQQLMERLAAGTESRAVAPQSGGIANGNGAAAGNANPTEFLLCCAPVIVGDESRGLIEIVQRPDVSPAACEGFLQFLKSVAVLASDFLRNSDLRTLQSEASLWNQFGEFSERIHKGLDIRAVASAIANEARPLIGCDRVTVAVRRGSRLRVEAVSGVDSIDRRADTIRAGEELIHRVARVREPVWHDDTVSSGDQKTSLPPQIEKPLNRYLDDSPVRILGVLPLVAVPGEEACGAIIVERFEGANAEQLRRRASVVARHSAAAVANSLQHSNLPLLWFLRLVSRMAWYLRLRQLPRTTVVLGLLAGIGFALAVVPADFAIEGRGELQPLQRRGIFASTDGVVSGLSEKLRTAKGKRISVHQSETLIELRSSSLEFEATRVSGELRTARQSLNTVEIQRRTTDDPAKEEDLAAEATELAVTIKGLQEQDAVLSKWKTELSLTSPIDGQVLTFDPVAVLENRPVRQGERLLQIADVAGPWIIEVRVADQNIGFVNDAVRELKPDLDVSFVVATSPEKTWTGKVRSIRRETTSNRDDGPTVLVTVDIDRSAIPDEILRPGATVIPHIHCGTRSVGFVWFHELIHAIRTKLLF